MNELEIEELERNLAENNSYKEEERSANDTGNTLGEVMRIFWQDLTCGIFRCYTLVIKFGNRSKETGITVGIGQVQKSVL